MLSAASAGPAMAVQRRAFADRQPIEDVLEVRLDVGEFVGAQHALEHIEAAAPVGLEDVGMQAAVGSEADRPAVAQGEGAALACGEIGAHRGFLVVDRHCSSCLSPESFCAHSVSYHGCEKVASLLTDTEMTRLPGTKAFTTILLLPAALPLV